MSDWDYIISVIPASLHEVFADHHENPNAIEIINEGFIKTLVSSSVFHSGQGIGITGNGNKDAIRSAKKSYIENGGDFSKTNRLFISIRSGIELHDYRIREVMTLLKHKLYPQARIHLAWAINKKLNDSIVITLIGTDEIQIGAIQDSLDCSSKGNT